jgi:hypothetical protein
MRRWALLVGLAACGQPSSAHTGGGDAGFGAFSIDPGAADIVANPLLTRRTITISGDPLTRVRIDLDRSSAGVLYPPVLQLDANGAGTTELMPCLGTIAGCTGSVTFTLSLDAPDSDPLVSAERNLVASPFVGELMPCQTTSNVLFLHGTDYILDGTHSTDPGSTWTVEPSPGGVWSTVDDADGRYTARFSAAINQPLTTGVFDDVTRAAFQQPGHPGLEVLTPHKGCNQVGGRFEVHDYTADPQTGALGSITISFEEFCDEPQTLPVPRFVQGCMHFEQQLPTTMTPPTPDPTKVSVQVTDATTGKPDTTARAIFTATDGTFVLDTVVNAFGQAEADMPTGGTLTVIQLDANNGETLHSYRGVVNGNHIVLDNTPLATGTKDTMLVAFTAPPVTNGVGFATRCGGATYAGFGQAYLPFYDTCRTPTFSMLSISGTPTLTDPPQFIWQTGIAHVPNGNLSVTGPWTPFSTGTVTVTNVTLPMPSIGTRWTTYIGKYAAYDDTVAIQFPTAGTNSASHYYAAGAGDRSLITVWHDAGGYDSSEHWTAAYASVPSNVAIDFNAMPVPKLSGLQQGRTGTRWTQTAGNADVRSVMWRAIANGKGVTWWILEPNDGQASTTLPALPAADAALDPTKDAAAQAKGTAVTYDDYDVASGFVLSAPSVDHKSHGFTIGSGPTPSFAY